MRHYVVYHNADSWGPFAGKPAFTGKRYREETLLGNRLWVLEGTGAPKRYAIVSSGLIEKVRQGNRPPQYRRRGRDTGLHIQFSPNSRQCVEIPNEHWFRRFRRSQQSFRLGMTRISNREVVRSLQALWSTSLQNGEQGLLDDIEAIEQDPRVTSKKALVDARLGQGTFRKKLVRRWGNACAVTGCSVLAILKASHIKPWKLSTNSERLNSANGLLLAAHLDALFDAGLISFSDEGKMLMSREIPPKVAALFRMPGALRKDLKEAEKRYLRVHRSEKFKC